MDHRGRLTRDIQRLAQEAQRLAAEASPEELAFGTQTLAGQALRIALRAARLDEAREQQ